MHLPLVLPPVVTGYLLLLLFGRNGWLGKLFGRDRAAYSYLPSSMGEFLTAREFASLLEEMGYTDVFVERQTFGIAHIVGGRLKDE